MALLTLAVHASAKETPTDDDGDEDEKKANAKADEDRIGKAPDDKAQGDKARRRKTDGSPGRGSGAHGKDAELKGGHGKDAGKSDDEQSDDDDDETQAEKAADRFPQPVVVGSLLRRTVLQPQESKPVLGRVASIVRAKDGTLDAVVNYGGFFGFYTRPIAVPIDAMALLGDDMEILDFTPEQLKDFPTFDPAGTTPVPRSETIRVALAKPAH